MPYVIVTADGSNSRHYAESVESMPCGQLGHLDMGEGIRSIDVSIVEP